MQQDRDALKKITRKDPQAETRAKLQAMLSAKSSLNSCSMSTKETAFGKELSSFLADLPTMTPKDYQRKNVNHSEMIAGDTNQIQKGLNFKAMTTQADPPARTRVKRGSDAVAGHSGQTEHPGWTKEVSFASELSNFVTDLPTGAMSEVEGVAPSRSKRKIFQLSAELDDDVHRLTERQSIFGKRLGALLADLNK